MSNVLKRKMFNTPKYEHKSTGIASGLEYRPGYKTGGRVGFSNGGGAYDLPFDPLPGMGPIQPNITPSNNPPLSPHGDFDVSPTPPVTDEVIANINPDLLTETKQDYLTTPDPLTESQRIAKLLMGEIPGTDFSKYAIDFDKYAVDYDKYGPSRLGAVGTAAGRVIKDPIPAEVSQVGSFFGNLAETSSDYRARKDELALMAEQDAKKMAMLTDQQAQDLAFKSEESIRANKKAEADLTVDLYKGALADELAREEIATNMALANQDFETRLEVANIGKEEALAVQSMINAKMPDKLIMMLALQKPKSEGGMNLSADDAFATVFGQRDDQIQFASALMQAYSQGAKTANQAAKAVQQTIQAMNLLFPGVFNLTEEEIAGLAVVTDKSKMPPAGGG